MIADGSCAATTWTASRLCTRRSPTPNTEHAPPRGACVVTSLSWRPTAQSSAATPTKRKESVRRSFANRDGLDSGRVPRQLSQYSCGPVRPSDQVRRGFVGTVGSSALSGDKARLHWLRSEARPPRTARARPGQPTWGPRSRRARSIAIHPSIDIRTARQGLPANLLARTRGHPVTRFGATQCRAYD